MVWWLLTAVVVLLSGGAFAQAPSASFTTTVTPSSEAEWTLNASSITGTTVADASGHGNTATVVNGPLNFPSPPAGASFTAHTQYVDSTLSMGGYPALTVSFWFNPASLDSEDSANYSVRLVANSQVNVYSNGFQMFFDPGGPSGGFYVGNGSTFAAAGWTQQLAKGSWYCFAGVYDGATVKAYLNGSQVASTAFAGGNLAAGSGPDINVARLPSGHGYYTGDIYDVQIKKIALTATQVSSLCNATTPPATLTVIVNSAVSMTGPYSANQTVETLQGIWSDGSAFKGSFVITSQPAGSYFAISGSNLVVTSAGATAFNAIGATTVENVMVGAQQLNDIFSSYQLLLP